MNSRSKIVPAFSVVEERIVIPDSNGFVAADFFEIVGRARKRPFLPVTAVSVSHGVVVDVV